MDTNRNIPDEAAKNVAAKGGVIGLRFGNTFSNRQYYDWHQKGRPFGDVSASMKRYSAFETIEALDQAVGKTCALSSRAHQART